MNDKMPVFVKIDEYKDVLDILAVVKDKIADAKEIVEKISDLKHEEDSELESARASLEDIDDKVKFVSEALYEPEM